MADNQVTKWDKASKSFDLFSRGTELRYGKYKRSLFAKARGKTLLVAAGTGLDFEFFPPGLEITAIDFSPKMLEKAAEKTGGYKGNIELLEADVTNLKFEDNSFDTIVTSCTFCSVPDPVKGLKELNRVLKPDGQLLMFEHVRPTNFILGAMMDILTPIVNKMGPDLNRRTADNVRKAGFTITREFNVYLDMVKLFECRHPAGGGD
jgi:ubiquinone/menaquinone biosynthesis C-methylase UbiE